MKFTTMKMSGMITDLNTTRHRYISLAPYRREGLQPVTMVVCRANLHPWPVSDWSATGGINARWWAWFGRRPCHSHVGLDDRIELLVVGEEDIEHTGRHDATNEELDHHAVEVDVAAQSQQAESQAATASTR